MTSAIPVPYTASLRHTLRNTFRLRGRASRSEYRRFLLTCWATQFVLAAALVFTVLSDLGTVLLVALFVAFSIGFYASATTLMVRRLHDTDSSGWWVVLPFVQLLLLFVKGDETANRYGDVPSV